MDTQTPLQTGIAHHRAGRLAQAEAIYRGLLARNPNDADALHLLGLLACQAGQLDTAAQLMGRAVAMSPGAAEMWINLGEVHRRRRDFGAAIAALERGVALSPGNAEAFFNLATALSDAGQTQQAKELLGKCLALNPQHAGALNNMGLLLRAQGDLQQAAECFTRAVAARAGYVEALNNLGLTLWDLHRPEEALGAFGRAIDESPQFALAHANLAFALRRMGRVPEALASWQRAAALSPQSAEIQHSMAMGHLELGQIAEAVAAARRAVELAPQNPGAHHALGVALATWSKTDPAQWRAALAAYDRALELKPAAAEWQFERAALAGQETRSAPDAYVKNLFDEYALRFESHLVEELQYRAPEDLLAGVLKLKKSPHIGPLWDVLDLGCGTGRCGELFRLYARKIVGVDLAANMIEISRNRAGGRIYDELLNMHIAEALARYTDAFDVLVAADVFIYVGALEEVMPAAARAMRRGGLFAFSLESYEGEGFILHRQHRFAHSLSYIRRVAQSAGLTEALVEPCALRSDVPPGWAVVLEKPR